MDSSDHKGAESPPTPKGNVRHASCASDDSTVCGSEFEKRDLESNSIKQIDRSLSHYLGLASPISANLEDIEEDLADSDDEEAADVNALDYHRSTSMATNSYCATLTDART
jgi:hypothetical protein